MSRPQLEDLAQELATRTRWYRWRRGPAIFRACTAGAKRSVLQGNGSTRAKIACQIRDAEMDLMVKRGNPPGIASLQDIVDRKACS
jgi:hypothetical protein